MTPVDRSGLARVVRDCAAFLRRRSGLAAALLAAAVLLAALPIAWLLAGPDGWAPGSAGPAVLLFLVASGAVVGSVVVWRKGVRWASDDRIARQIERSSELPDGRVRAQLELSRGRGKPGPGLTEAGERAVLSRLGKGAEGLVRDGYLATRRLVRTGLALATSLILMSLALHGLSPDRARGAWGGLTSPIQVLRPGPLPPLGVQPGNSAAPRGTQVRVEVDAPGRSRVTLHREAAGEVPGERVIEVLDGAARADLPPLDGPMDYWVSAPDGAVSDTFRLEPSDPLLMSRLQIEVRFPAYLDRPTERLDEVPESLDVPSGSELRVSGELSGPASALHLQRADGSTAARADASTGSFEMAWTPRESGVIGWSVSPSVPAGTRLPDPFRIELIPDAPPQVALETDGGVRRFPRSLVLPLRIQATDDWGLDWVELQVVPEAPSGRPGDPVLDRTSAEGRRQVDLRPVLDVSGWGLEPGSKLRIRVRAVDLASGPGMAESDEIVVELPRAAELRDGARDRVDEVGRELETLSERARRTGEELRSMAREASGERTSGSTGGGGESRQFSESEALRSALEQQLGTAREMDGLRQELERARSSLGREAADESLARRIRELEALLDEQLATDSTGVGGELDPEALSASQEDLRERLEQAVERFRQAALENEFEGAEDALRDLGARQDSLAAALRDGDPAARSEQADLADEADAAAERLSELAERLDEAGDSTAARRAEAARQSVDDAGDSMRGARQQAQQGSPEAAGEAAERASERLDQAAGEIESARSEWMEARDEEVRNALLRGAHDALSLAGIQGAVRADMRSGSSEGRGELLSRQAVLLESIRNLAARLSSVTREVPAVGRVLSRSVGEALADANAAAESLRTGAVAGGAPFAAARSAEDGLKQVAVRALQGMDRIGDSAPPSDTQELSQELSGLAGEQESMNQEAQSLAEQPGAEGASARMEELAGAQEAMAGALGELAERFGGGTDQDPVARMAEEAAEIAREFDEGRIDAETLDRQEALLDRLLEAGRSLERDGPTEEREGTSPEDFERPTVRELDLDLLQANEITLPGPEALQLLSPAERRLVLDYFERLSRAAGGRP